MFLDLCVPAVVSGFGILSSCNGAGRPPSVCQDTSGAETAAPRRAARRRVEYHTTVCSNYAEDDTRPKCNAQFCGTKSGNVFEG